MSIEEILSSTSIPEGAKVEVLAFCKARDRKLVFAPDAYVIGEQNEDDPDGGRSIYTAALVEIEGFSLEFVYIEKWWTGLCLNVDGKESRLPLWAVQEED